MNIEYKPLEKLTPYVNNPKKHPETQLDKIASSIKEFGFKVPILISEDNTIIAGHGRYEAARDIEMDKVPCIIADDLTDAQIKAFRIADNRIAESSWDDELLSVELEELDELDFNLDMTGFDEGEQGLYLDLSAEIEEEYIEEVPDEVETDIERGDVFQLGDHRLMCGDATDEEDVDRLMDGEQADMVFTDPPYDFDFENLHRSFRNVKSITDLHFWMGSDKQQIELCQDDSFTHFFIHDFKAPTMISNNQPMSQHTLISKFGNRKIRNIKDCFTTIIKVATLRGHEKNFNMGKRIELPSEFIRHYSEQGDIIADLFGGTGSTLIACEQLDRRCYMMELDPKMCQWIIDRYNDFV